MCQATDMLSYAVPRHVMSCHASVWQVMLEHAACAVYNAVPSKTLLQATMQRAVHVYHVKVPCHQAHCAQLRL